MNPAIQPKPVFTGDIARAVGTSTRMVRTAISRDLASATKIGGRWILTPLQAAAAAIVLILRSIGLSWVEIPAALSSGIYHYPQDVTATEPAIQETEGYHKLCHYLAVTLFDMCVMIKGCGDIRSRSVEFWQDDQMPPVDASHPVTLIPIEPILRTILDTERAKHQPKPSSSSLRCSNANEIKRLAIVESLAEALQLASDPGVATDYPKVSELGSLLEDLVGFAMDVAVDLQKNNDD